MEKAFVGSYHAHNGDGTEYGNRQSTGGPRALDGRPSEADREYDPGKTLGWKPTCKCHICRCPRCGLVLEYSGKTGYSRSKPNAANQVSEVRTTSGCQEQDTAVLQPVVCEQFQRQGQEPHLANAQTDSMQDVQQDVSAKGGAPSVLQQALFDPTHSQGTTGQAPNEAGLHCNLEATSPERGQIGLCDGTSPSDGEPLGEIPQTKRGRSSQKRRQGRQQAGKPGTDVEAETRPTSKTEEEDRLLSSLRENSSPVELCPDCQTRLVIELITPRAGLILDPFSGSGRTLLTAQRMGLDAVGVELNPEYIAMARKILREDSPLFAGGVE